MNEYNITHFRIKSLTIIPIVFIIIIIVAIEIARSEIMDQASEEISMIKVTAISTALDQIRQSYGGASSSATISTNNHSFTTTTANSNDGKYSISEQQAIETVKLKALAEVLGVKRIIHCI